MNLFKQDPSHSVQPEFKGRYGHTGVQLPIFHRLQMQRFSPAGF